MVNPNNGDCHLFKQGCTYVADSSAPFEIYKLPDTCEKSQEIDTSLANPPEDIPFVSGGTGVMITNSADDLLTHYDFASCFVESAEIKASDCVNPYIDDKVELTILHGIKAKNSI